MRNNRRFYKAYEVIRHSLLANIITPGERLTEQAWADKLVLNRDDIRQAFVALHTEGLLKSGERGGYFAHAFSGKEQQERIEVRTILEKAAARLAVERATKADISELGKICALMKQAAKHGYQDGLQEIDLHFHEVFVKAAHNLHLSKLYKLANLPLYTMKTAYFTEEEHKRQNQKDVLEHQHIVKALKTKNLQKLIKIIEASSAGLNNRALKVRV
jgi:DNA-binding GntR family transcriptional regulator